MYIEEFNKTICKELDKHHYIGLFSLCNLTSLISPFQSSPISIIPKPGRPGKFRLVQNVSFPLKPSPNFPSPSINSSIRTDDFHTTWGTFSIIALLMAQLPPGLEAATRDVAEAYRTIPLNSFQWPSAIVRANTDQFYLVTCLTFGASPSSGVYGHVTNAGAEIMRSEGIGPLDKWVNDHIFFRVR